MIKLKKSLLGALLTVAATSLTSCGPKSNADVTFWSSFGAKYRGLLDTITAEMGEELGIKIEHVSKGSYDNIYDAIVGSTANKTYPDIAVGYPDHFAKYQGSKILVSLDDLVTGELLADYDKDYMPENYLYEKTGQKRLYGLPFNKSTEVLGYNGVFVDYVAEKYNDEDLKNLPQTWAEWGSTDPESKVQKYLTTFTNLINSKKTLFGVQEEDGHAHDFVLSSNSSEAGKKALLDYSKFDASMVAQSRLMTWDSCDNAFITLVRQWGAEYTKLEEDQITESPLRRQGTIKFASEDNIDKTVDMLKTFNRMYINNIFATPATLGGSYGSDAFASGRCMFMVCSTGGLSYNTGSWNNRFSITTIPFKDAEHKYVIAQGANICMTNKADKAKAFEVIKGLTTGKFQTEWALQTGYFPASNSAADSEEYDAFLKGTDYSNPTVVAYREGAQINQYEYRDVNNKFSEAEKWHRFVDDAFIGSSVIRQLVKGILGDTFINCPDNNGTPASDDDYKSVLKFYLSKSEISGNTNIRVDTKLKIN